MTAGDVINYLHLTPLEVEGGWVRQTYRSARPREADSPDSGLRDYRPAASAIYYLLTREEDSFSALHSLPMDEVWHFYMGAPVELLLLYPTGESRRVILGTDLQAGQQPQLVIPAGVWQGARLAGETGDWALTGCTMAPGFSPRDYTGGDRNRLIRQYPREEELIRALTRPDAPLYMNSSSESL